MGRDTRKRHLLFHLRLFWSLANLLPDKRDDLCAGTLGLSLLRYAVSQSATGHASQGHILMVLDIKPAFLCGETKRAISLELPDEDRNGRNPQLVGKLHEALCGIRDALQQRQEHFTTTLEKITGFREVICLPGDVKLVEQNVTLVVHVDDIVTVVAENSLKMKRERLE